MDREMTEHLIECAFDARTHSYCPYSGFAVGAALLTAQNDIYTGCNIENAAYSPSNCAERTAVFKAVSEGERTFCAIAVVGGKKQCAEGEVDYCTPCGVCRQVLLEFCDKDFEIIVATDRHHYRIYTLGELVPAGFGSANL